MKSVIIFLKIFQAAAGICSLLLLLNDCRKEVFTPGTTEKFPLRSSSHVPAYYIELGLHDNYNLAEKYTTILLPSSHLPF